MKRFLLNLSLVVVFVLALSLPVFADTSQVPQGSEMYAPLVFNGYVEQSRSGSSGPIPETEITDFQTPRVRSSIAGGTKYWGDVFFLYPEQPDDYARLNYYFLDEFSYPDSPYNLTFRLDPVYLDITGLMDEAGDDWVNFLPIFTLSTYGVNSRITVSANITSVDPSGTARDNLSIANVYNGKTTNEEHIIRFSGYLPDYEYGDKLYVNEFTITCENYSGGFSDGYVTGFLSDTYTEPIDAQNAPTRVELSSVPLVSILWNSIVDVFEIDLIPGLSLGTILLAIVGLPLLVWFLKLVAGG